MNGYAKDKADKVLDSFFSSLPYFMQSTGDYSEEQLRQFGRNQKAPQDKYRSLLREQFPDLNSRDIARIFAEDCEMVGNHHISEAAEAVYHVTTHIIHEAYRTHYKPS